MKRYFTNTITALTLLIGLVASAQAGTVALATAPLATSTTVAVKPNILFVLDNSGSMSWTFLLSLFILSSNLIFSLSYHEHTVSGCISYQEIKAQNLRPHLTSSTFC